MLQQLRPRSIYDVMAAFACLAALAGGTAYAANEWTGANIQDETLTGADVRGTNAGATTAGVNGSLTSADISGQPAVPAVGQPFVNGTLTTSDVKDDSLTSADIKNLSLGNGDFLTGSVNSRAVTDDSLTGADIQDFSLENRDFPTGSVDSRAVTDDSLTNVDIKNFSLGNGDFLTGSVDSRAATDNSLTGTDIDESTLQLPPTTTATFAGNASELSLSTGFVKVAAKILAAGSWAVTATANTSALVGPVDAGNGDLVCQLRNGSAFIGGATDRRLVASGAVAKRSLSMNGGAQVPAGGGEVSLWCSSQFSAGERITYSQMMMIRLDGFS